MDASDPALDAVLQGRPPRGPGHYLRDIVYGANDGAITTLAVVAGAAGASLSPFVALVLGTAGLLGDGISMAAANYQSLRSDLEQRRLPPALERPFRHALATLFAFLAAGVLPLVAYVLPPVGTPLRLTLATTLALAAIGLVGVWRAGFVQKTRTRSFLEAVGIGALAAGVAYGVGVGARSFAPEM